MEIQDSSDAKNGGLRTLRHRIMVVCAVVLCVAAATVTSYCFALAQVRESLSQRGVIGPVLFARPAMFTEGHVIVWRVRVEFEDVLTMSPPVFVVSMTGALLKEPDDTPASGPDEPTPYED